MKQNEIIWIIITIIVSTITYSITTRITSNSSKKNINMRNISIGQNSKVYDRSTTISTPFLAVAMIIIISVALYLILIKNLLLF